MKKYIFILLLSFFLFSTPIHAFTDDEVTAISQTIQFITVFFYLASFSMGFHLGSYIYKTR